MTEERRNELLGQKLMLLKKFITENGMNSLAMLAVTTEDERDGDPCMGSAVLIDPMLIGIVEEKRDEETGDALLEGIRKVLDEATEKVIRLIAEAAGNQDVEIKCVEEAEEGE